MTEDLGIKIVSKKEKLWTEVKESSERKILEAEADIKISKKIIELAEEEIRNI